MGGSVSVRREAKNVSDGNGPEGRLPGAQGGLSVVEPVRWAEIRTGWRERRFDPVRQALIKRSGLAAVESVDRIVSPTKQR
jgi:hypothetical protein